MNKDYYIPNIEEFHAGFEYEILNKKDVWLKQTFGKHSYAPTTKKDLPLHYFRVKYLDKEDIEDLGWVVKEKFSNGIITAIKDYYNEREDSVDTIYLRYSQNQSWCLLYINEDVTRFSGVIKNKSELKVIMKQLSI